MATIDELYDSILFDDTEALEEYLQSIDPVTYHQLDKIKSLLAYAVDKNKIDAVKLLIEYNANPEMWSDWLFILAKEKGSLAMQNYLKTGKDLSTDTEC